MKIRNKDLQRSSLQEQLNHYEGQLAYYEETALNSARTLIRTATLQFGKQDIEYFELIQSISVALDIERTYLEQLMGYNRVAIEMEYLKQ
jgi:cobalt-zinc-cadmium resistance protein CzcA